MNTTTRAVSSAVFVGGGSLLIRCAQAYLGAGHVVQAVVSDNPKILQWARSLGIPALALDDPARLDLSGLSADYLFSVANLRVLPPAVIGVARQLAINFHDALLPRYAGLNATAWALMAGETSHGITWHEMTRAVDAGRIVQQVGFDIAPGETALSLNAKCYEAGFAGFMALLGEMQTGGLRLTPQQGERGSFGASARPALLATLDFSSSAGQIAALVRALDFGPYPYPNPLARPKIFTGEKLLLVRSARLSEAADWALPGTVIDVQGDSVQVATADGVVVLGGCSDLHGGAHGLHAGMLLPPLSQELQQALSERTLKTGRGEGFWFDTFARRVPLEWPYPRRLAALQDAKGPAGAVGLAGAMGRTEAIKAVESLEPGAPHILPLNVAAQGARSVAGLLAWLSALTGQARLTVFYGDATLCEQARALEPWLSPWVPLNMSIALERPIADVVDNTQARISQIHRAGPFARDLPTRLADKPAPLARAATWGVCLSGQFNEDADDAPALLLTSDSSGRELVLVVDSAFYASPTAQLMASHLAAYLQAFEAASDQATVAEISLLPQQEAALLNALNDNATPFDTLGCAHELIAAQAALNPSQLAISFQGQEMTRQQLEAQACALAVRLRQRGVQPGDVVGLCLERTPALVVGLLAIWKAGAAYLPLDPAYPAHRLTFMVQDSATRLVLTTRPLAQALALAPQQTLLLEEPAAPDSGAAPALPNELAQAGPDGVGVDPLRAAYVIYTSGSTGKPKGVVVTHRNVMNFFAGMDQRVPVDLGARWLAVTSLSFDISVLELGWTLCRGLAVVLHSSVPPAVQTGPEFSLFFFGNDNPAQAQERYQLLFEGARFADREGFAAVWTPERHFHAFGGLYPNAAMTSAALAAATERVQIRAGSCVLPLHHPIRAAEDWAFVDNISHGRVGVSFAAGWQPNDFALAPAAFANRKTEMFSSIDKVRRLWRGESVAFDSPLGGQVDIQTRPSPIQTEIPVWVTAAGNPETFQQAGQLGYRVLTHLLGQSLSDVASKIALYRQAWRQAGHAGQGYVTLMLHTFVGDDEDAVREAVRQPMKAYLASSVDLIRQAAWSFPTFVQRSSGNGKTPLEIMESEPLSADDMDALLEHAFARYYNTSALFGTQERCLAMVDKLRGVGVDEIGCLVDFGIEAEAVQAHLHDLKELMDAARQSRASGQRASVAEDIVRHGVTHLQCTPSMASMLVADAPGRAALARLSALLVGGEALPLELARQLTALVPGKVVNMYGPTETTVWSSTCDLTACDLSAPGAFVPLGQAIANTRLKVCNSAGLDAPALVPGELWIGGEGVTRGYLGRPELTAERFVADPVQAGQRWYRTGDLVRRHPDGALEFLGRTDHQVKIRGHRIELGEIESLLLRQPGVRQAVVLARDDPSGGHRLVAYVTPHAGFALQPDLLRQALVAELPEIMLPASILVLLAFPMTPNGKVDRLALPDPRAAIVLPQTAAPESDIERTIAALWRDVLGLSEVGVNDNFFDLGGHSLLVVQVQRRLREASGREVSITDMFRFPTIRGLALHLAGQATSSAVGEGLSRARQRRNLRTPAAPASQPATSA